MKKLMLVNVIIALLLMVSASAFAADGHDGSWAVDADGLWTLGTNWTSSVIPGQSGTTDNNDKATFSNHLTNNRFITVDAGRNVQFIDFRSPAFVDQFGFTLQGGLLKLTNGGGITSEQFTPATGQRESKISSPIELQGDHGTATFSDNGEELTFLNISGGVTGVSTAGNTTTLTLQGTNQERSEINGVIGDGSGGGKLALTKADAGIWILSGANTYTGDTKVDGGTLILRNNLALQNSALDTSGAGVIDVTGFTTPTLGGLKGSTALASVITTGYVDVTGLTLNPGTGVTDTYSGVIADSTVGMALTKSGLGTQVLSGTNTYSGVTNINAGTLVVDGSIATSSLTSVNSGGILQGSGTTGAVSINSGGILSPGNSPGTLTSAGGATYGGGGTYLWQINNATGAAGNPTGWDLHNITGGALNISATSGSKFTIDITGLNAGNTSGAVVNFNKFTNYTWKIASATGGVTDFAANKFNLLTTNFTNNNNITGVKSNGFFSIGSLGNDLQLIYTAAVNATNYASDANPGDTNARNVGTVLDNITNPTADMTNVLNTMSGLSRAQVAAALDTLVPQVDAGVLNTDRASLNNFTQLSTDRVEKAHTEVQSKHPARSGISSGEAGKLDGLWAKGYGSYLTQGTRGGIAGYNAWNAGTALGVDRRFTDALTLGISGGYAYGNVNSDANSANTTINSAQTTLYGGYQDQKRPFFIDTAVSFAYNWYAGRRNINVGNVILRTANGSYDGQQYGAYLGGGYRFKFADAIEVTPLVSLQYNNLHINNYNETGAGALNLNAGTQNYNQLQSGLGGRIATTLSSQWGKVTPELHSKWLYDFFGDPFAVTSNFNGGGAAFGSNGAKPAVNSFNVGGELKLDLRDEIALIGKVDTQLRQGFSGVFGSFTVRF
ncbi:MAG: autotransporter domain-containing protein [Methylococcaceae bacterium]